MEKNLDNQEKDLRQEKVQKLKKMRRWQIVVSIIGIAILGIGIWQSVELFLDFKRTEVSNDAQIEQYISPINMRASGYIKKICFTEHQNVRKGDTLLILDDREYKIRVMEAEAALKDAQAGAHVIDASLITTENKASVFEASLAEVEVRLAKLEKDRQRYQNLVARNAATPIQLEQIETEYAATLKKKRCAGASAACGSFGSERSFNKKSQYRSCHSKSYSCPGNGQTELVLYRGGSTMRRKVG